MAMTTTTYDNKHTISKNIPDNEIDKMVDTQNNTTTTNEYSWNTIFPKTTEKNDKRWRDCFCVHKNGNNESEKSRKAKWESVFRFGRVESENVELVIFPRSHNCTYFFCVCFIGLRLHFLLFRLCHFHSIRRWTTIEAKSNNDDYFCAPRKAMKNQEENFRAKRDWKQVRFSFLHSVGNEATHK